MVLLNGTRLVSLPKGFTQEYDINYEETISPVAKITSIHTLLALAATRHRPFYQMDVRNAFLNGELSEVVYMQPLPGVTTPPGNVCKL